MPCHQNLALRNMQHNDLLLPSFDVIIRVRFICCLLCVSITFLFLQILLVKTLMSTDSANQCMDQDGASTQVPDTDTKKASGKFSEDLKRPTESF